MNETTFEERFAIRLSRLNVFVVVSLSLLVSFLLGCFLIAYTPLREYVPGYGNVEDREKIAELSIVADSVEQELVSRDMYFSNFFNLLSNLDSALFADNLELFGNPSSDYSSSTPLAESSTYKFLVSPMNGSVVSKFSPENNHYGIDIVGGKNDIVRSIADGVVIFSDWTLDGGKTIIVQHSSDVVSVYKHNSVLLKKQGESVFADSPLAMIGNTGEESTGFHLHFEIWINQQAVDPEQYIVIN